MKEDPDQVGGGAEVGGCTSSRIQLRHIACKAPGFAFNPCSYEVRIPGFSKVCSFKFCLCRYAEAIQARRAHPSELEPDEVGLVKVESS